MKLYLILAAIVVFAFFSNDFGLVDIQKTAIILAAGIDKTERGFSVTAQIAVPKGSDRTTGGTSSVEIEAEGATVSDCISLIFAKTGWVPKLVFCDLIVIGEEAAREEDIISHLNYFLRNDYMPDSCMLAVCAGKAGALISSPSAIDDASSLAITKLFSDAAQKSGMVAVSTLKDFTIGYYGVSESGFLPYIRMNTQEGGQSAGDGHAAVPEENQKVYIAEETALFKKGRMVALLTREETFAFSLLRGKVFSGTLNAMDGEKPVTLTVVRNKGGVSLKMKEVPTAELSLSLTLRLCCRGVSAAITDIASDSVSPEILQSAHDLLIEHVEKLFTTAKEAGCDLFMLRRDLFRRSLKEYAKWKDALLPALQLSPKIALNSMK